MLSGNQQFVRSVFLLLKSRAGSAGFALAAIRVIVGLGVMESRIRDG